MLQMQPGQLDLLREVPRLPGVQENVLPTMHARQSKDMHKLLD